MNFLEVRTSIDAKDVTPNFLGDEFGISEKVIFFRLENEAKELVDIDSGYYLILNDKRGFRQQISSYTCVNNSDDGYWIGGDFSYDPNDGLIKNGDLKKNFHYSIGGRLTKGEIDALKEIDTRLTKVGLMGNFDPIENITSALKKITELNLRNEFIDFFVSFALFYVADDATCLLYTSPSPRDATLSRMPSSA